VPDPRTDRITELAEQLQTLPPLDPPAVRLARAAVNAARRDLAAARRSGAPGTSLDALQYRVERRHDRLAAAWADAG
jgi:hypothetical protein